MLMARKTRTAIHGQKKKEVSMMLTPESLEFLDTQAHALGISRSEFVERMARAQKDSTETQLLGECSAT